MAIELDQATKRHIERSVDVLAEEFSGIFSRETIDAYVQQSLDEFAEARFPRLHPAHGGALLPRAASGAGPGGGQGDQRGPRGPLRLRPQRRAQPDGGRAARQARRGAGPRPLGRLATRPTRSTRPRSRRWRRSASTSPRSSRSRSTDEVVRAADAVITMGCGDACPIYPGKRYEDWELEDPAGKDLETVRRIRDEISERVDGLVASLTSTSDRLNGRRFARAPPARRVPRLRLPRRRRDRLRDRRRHPLPRRHRPAAVRERGRDRGGPVHDHPHVRPGLRRPLQPGRLARGRELRRPPLAARPRLHPRPDRGLHRRGDHRERDVRPGGDQHLRQAPRLGGTPLRRGDRDARPAAGDLLPGAHAARLDSPRRRSAPTSAPPTSSPARPASPTPRSRSGGCSPTPSPASRPLRCPASLSPS